MKSHKGLEAWQEAHRVVNLALDVARDHWRPHLREVLGQLSGASLSAQINISEGYGLGTEQQFVRHLRIAYGSALEAGDLVDLLVERREIPEPLGNELQLRSHRTQRLLLGLIKRYQA